jgi:hypothetical protein
MFQDVHAPRVDARAEVAVLAELYHQNKLSVGEVIQRLYLSTRSGLPEAERAVVERLDRELDLSDSRYGVSIDDVRRELEHFLSPFAFER